MDTGAGKITIAHGPVEALKWPAMTMAFKASPEQLASVKAGQQVEFEFEAKGMDSTITRITPTKLVATSTRKAAYGRLSVFVDVS